MFKIKKFRYTDVKSQLAPPPPSSPTSANVRVKNQSPLLTHYNKNIRKQYQSSHSPSRQKQKTNYNISEQYMTKKQSQLKFSDYMYDKNPSQSSELKNTNRPTTLERSIQMQRYLDSEDYSKEEKLQQINSQNSERRNSKNHKGVPCSLNVNLNKFQQYFRDSKDEETCIKNKLVQLKYQSKQSAVRRAIITYRRFPLPKGLTMTTVLEQKKNQERNNFIVQRVEKNQKLKKALNTRKKEISAQFSNLLGKNSTINVQSGTDNPEENNFTNHKKYKSGIKLMKNQSPELSHKNKLNKILQLVPQETNGKNQNIIKDKIMTYRLFLDLVLNSNNLKYKESSSSYNFQNFYNVYIQDGNNHEILKTLARRKNGWRVVECPEVANLIWTQRYRKNLAIRPKRGNCTSSTYYAEQEQDYNKMNNSSNQNIKKVSATNCVIMNQNKGINAEGRTAVISTSWRNRRTVYGNANRSYSRTYEKTRTALSSQDYQYNSLSPNRVGTSKLGKNHKSPEKNQRVYDIKQQEQFDIIVSRISRKSCVPLSHCRQWNLSFNTTILNHLPGNKSICDKKNLVNNLTAYYMQKGKDPFNYIPESINIKNLDDFEKIKLDIKMKQFSWIIKPGEDTNRGRGIAICPIWEDLQKQVVERFSTNKSNSTSEKTQSKIENDLLLSVRIKNFSSTIPHQQNYSELIGQNSGNIPENSPHIKITSKNRNTNSKVLNRSLLIQRYIQPLLYNSRKFDIRMYLLVTCSNGKLKAYLYDEGYIRTCSMLFTMKNNNRYVHLTNDAIQYYGPDYGKYQEGNKLSFRHFQQWFNSLQANQKYHQQHVTHEKNETDSSPNNMKTLYSHGNRGKIIVNQDLKDEKLESTAQFSPQIQQKYNHSQEQSEISSKHLPKDFSPWEIVLQEMRNLSRDVIKSVKDKLILPVQKSVNMAENSCLHFQLYGLDFLIDSAKKVWLIQVNNNPALNTENSRLLDRVIPKMLDNVLMLAVQPYMRQHRVREGKYQNKFQVVYEQ